MFYWSHLSYIWVWVLLIVHCANFWKWFVTPGVIFLVEKLVGIAVTRMAALYIAEVNLLPSKVLPNPNFKSSVVFYVLFLNKKYYLMLWFLYIKGYTSSD